MLIANEATGVIQPSVQIKAMSPSAELIRIYRKRGGRGLFGNWLPFGRIGPALMICHPEDDLPPEVAESKLVTPFRVSHADFRALQTFWLEDITSDDCASFEEPQWRGLNGSQILGALISSDLLSEEEMNTVPEGWEDTQPLPELSKEIEILVTALVHGTQAVDLRVIIPPQGQTLIGNIVMERYPSVHFSSSEEEELIAVTDPESIYAVENEVMANSDGSKDPRFYLAPHSQIQLLSESQSSGSDVSSLTTAERADTGKRLNSNIIEEVDREIPESILKLNERSRGVQTEQIVLKLLAQAASSNASDIHMEPLGEAGRIRFRIDGKLVTIMHPDDFTENLFRRISLVARDFANISMTDVFAPTGGRFAFRFQRRIYQVRASFTPLEGGNGKVVYRLQPMTASLDILEALDFSPQTLQALNAAIRVPQGLVLVTGPTGSGKSTTLYSVLNEINKPDINILTIEDPVEKRVPGLNQAGVDNLRGATFARLLREFLRQDPDALLVGEMRDKETILTCMEAALTGHLVFSTLHTNNAAEAADRLAVQSADPYVLAQCLTLMQAQRLIRKLCPHCKTPVDIKDEDAEALAQFGFEHLTEKQLWTPTGCPRCRKGYLSRRVVSEAILVDDEIRSIITAGNTREGTIAGRIQRHCKELGIRNYFQDALHFALKGETSISEALSVANAQQRLRFEKARGKA